MPVRCANSSKWYIYIYAVQNVQRPRTKRAKQSCKQTHKVHIHLKMKYFGFAQSLALFHSNTPKCSNKNPLHVIFQAALGSNCRTMPEPSWTCVQVMWALWFLAALPPLAWFLLLPGSGGNLCLGRIQPVRSQAPGIICQNRNHTTAGPESPSSLLIQSKNSCGPKLYSTATNHKIVKAPTDLLGHGSGYLFLKKQGQN